MKYSLQEALRELRNSEKSLSEDFNDEVELTGDQQNQIIEAIYEKAKVDIYNNNYSGVEYMPILKEICGITDLRKLKNSKDELDKIAIQVALKLEKEFGRKVYTAYTQSATVIFSFNGPSFNCLNKD